MKKIILLFFIFLTPLSVYPQSQNIYSWTDENGVKHFSDTPTYDQEHESKGTIHSWVDRHGKEHFSVEPPSEEQTIYTDEQAQENDNVNISDQPARVVNQKPVLNLDIYEIVFDALFQLWPFLLLLFMVLIIKAIIPNVISSLILKFLKKEKNVGYRDMNVENNFDNSEPHTARFKGYAGERKIISLLYKYLDRSTYYIFDDVTLPFQNGTTQIDHIIVSKYGIFVIETKNMKGLIDGNQYSKYWYQILKKHRYSFLSPIVQNEIHINALKALLKIEKEVFHNIVVFVQNVKFKERKPEGVFFPDDMIRFICHKTKVVYQDSYVKELIASIKVARLEQSFKIDEQHRNYVR